jgi:enolase-phosphatase E1
VSPRPAGVGAVLLDIEGTTTPLAFVTQVLFPYARAHLRSHLDQHAASELHMSLLARLRQEHQVSLERDEAPPAWTDGPAGARVASAVAFADWLMDRDRKSTPLKELQGLIWEDGYQRGALLGQVFPDVPQALRRWRHQQLQACIYSSGSVLAQRLLFRYSSAGDLTPLLHSFFDTNIGAKIESGSYRRIAQHLGRPAGTILFLSDAPRELDAARDAGMHVRLVIRPGNAPLSGGEEYSAVHGLDEI